MTTCISNVPNCGWSPDRTYTCPLCNQTVCYCTGCADDMPALCDDCWVELENEEGAGT